MNITKLQGSEIKTFLSEATTAQEAADKAIQG